MSIQESFKHAKQMLERRLLSLVYAVKEAYCSIKKNPKQAKTASLVLLGFTAGPFAVNATADLVYRTFSKTPPAIIQSAYAAQISVRASELSACFLSAADLQNINPEAQIDLVTTIYSAVVQAGADPAAKQDLETAVSAVFSNPATGMSRAEFGQDVLKLQEQYSDPQLSQMCASVAQYFGVNPNPNKPNAAAMPVPAPSPAIEIQKPAEPVKAVEQPAATQSSPQPDLESRIIPSPKQEYETQRIGTRYDQGNIYVGPRGQFSGTVGSTESTKYGSKTDRTNVNVSQGAKYVGLNHYENSSNRTEQSSTQFNARSGRNNTNVNLGMQERDRETENNTTFRVWGNGAGRTTSYGGSYQINNPRTGGYTFNVLRRPNNQFRVGLTFTKRHDVYEQTPVHQPNQTQRRASALDDRYLKAAEMLRAQAADARAHGNSRIAEVLETRANAALIIYNQRK